jgi:hypothetical protein
VPEALPLARQVKGRMSHKKYRTETNCLNCGAEVTGKFCPSCGQENLETRENFFHLAFHFISDYFHFDSKFFRSLVPLFIKPGFLTKEYWEGKRVHYIHPLRLYFFITIIFMVSATYFYQNLDKKVKRSFVDTNVTLSRTDSIALANDPNREQVIQSKHDEASRKAFIGMDRYFHDLKYISFLLLPVYALIFKLLYIRKKNLYVDHLVYTLHLQSFAYVLVGAVFLLALLFQDHLGLVRRITVFLLFAYIVLSLRFLYHQKWWKTILKSVIATGLIIFVMGLVLGFYVVLSYVNS